MVITQKLKKNEIKTGIFVLNDTNANKLMHKYKKVTIVFSLILSKIKLIEKD